MNRVPAGREASKRVSFSMKANDDDEDDGDEGYRKKLLDV